MAKIIPVGLSDLKMAMLVKHSIENEEDKNNTASMNIINTITDYMGSKCMQSTSQLRKTLRDIEEAPVSWKSHPQY